jgi:AraC-like DNA-binding protein
MSEQDTQERPLTAEAAERIARALRRVPLRRHFRVHKCYNLIVPPEWMIPPRANPDLHLLFVKGGRGTYFIDGAEEPLVRGKVILLASGVHHSAIQDRGDPPSIIPVRFGLYDNRSGRRVKAFPRPMSVALTPLDVAKYRFLFERLFRFCALPAGGQGRRSLPVPRPARAPPRPARRPGAGRRVAAAALGRAGGALSLSLGAAGSVVHEILAEMCLDLGESARPRDPRVERARLLMEERPSGRVSIDDLSVMAGLSRKHFSRLFRQETGVTPKAYQVAVRCNMARFLLEESDRTIHEVARALGYPDQFTFSRQFKKATGLSPSEVRGRGSPPM